MSVIETAFAERQSISIQNFRKKKVIVSLSGFRSVPILGRTYTPLRMQQSCSHAPSHIAFFPNRKLYQIALTQTRSNHKNPIHWWEPNSTTHTPQACIDVERRPSRSHIHRTNASSHCFAFIEEKRPFVRLQRNQVKLYTRQPFVAGFFFLFFFHHVNLAMAFEKNSKCSFSQLADWNVCNYYRN